MSETTIPTLRDKVRRKRLTDLLRKHQEGKTSASEVKELDLMLESEEGAPAAKTWQASTAMLVGLFGVNRKTIAEWTKNGMPKLNYGTYDFNKVFPWWLENIQTGKDESDETILIAKRQYWFAKADREELSVKKLQESVLDKADLDVVWTNRVIEVVKGLESQETILPTILENKKAPEIRKIIADYNRKLRLNYARDGKYTPVEEYNKLVEPVKKIVKPTKKKAKKKK